MSSRVESRNLDSRFEGCFFFSSRRRHTRCSRDWSSDVCSSDLEGLNVLQANGPAAFQSVAHFHLHLIPRWMRDGKGFDWKLVPGDREAIMKAGEKLRAALATRV